MQFQVPQFIGTEDKIVGRLTLKQFAYIGTAGLVIFGLYYILAAPLWLFVSLVLSATAIGLAFGKVNGRPAIEFLTAFIDNIWKPKVYVFRPAGATQTKESAPQVFVAPKQPERKISIKKPSFNGIRGLRDWIATSKTAIPKRERPLPVNFGRPQQEFKERYETIRKMTGEREVAKRVDFR